MYVHNFRAQLYEYPAYLKKSDVMTTLHDIAKRANVSYMTVARVLAGQNKENRPSSIARAMKIRRVAQEMGYRPNAAARAVIQGKFNTIALVQCRADSASGNPAACYWAIEDALANRKYRLTLNYVSHHVPADSMRMNHLLGEAFADGMLIDSTHPIPPQFGPLLQKHRIPTVWLHSARPHDAVRLDDFQGGMLATEHLVSQGHKRISYLDMTNNISLAADDSTHESARDRHAGYLEAMKKAGLTPQSFLTKKSTDPAAPGVLPVDEILSSSGPTALVSYGTEGLVRLHTLGEIRSHRLALVTFGETARALDGEIPIDTVLIPMARLAETAVDQLFQKISRPDQPLATAVVPYERVASLSSHPPHDGTRAEARSLSICAAPGLPARSLVGMNNDHATIRKSQKVTQGLSSLPDPGTYAGHAFPPPVRHDSVRATPPSPVPQAAAPSADEPAGRR